jgi:hypothetical protein
MPTKQSTVPASVEARIAPDALAGDDQRRFAEVLLNPPPLAPAMKRAQGPQAPDCRCEVTAFLRLEVLGAGCARAVRSEVAVLASVVDAKDDAAEAFYRHHGFERFGTKARQLIVSLKDSAPRDGLAVPASHLISGSIASLNFLNASSLTNCVTSNSASCWPASESLG